MARTRKNNSLLVGVFGSGSTPERNLTAQLDDLIDGIDDVTFVIPATKGHYNDQIASVVEWIDNQDSVDFDVITDDTSTSKAHKGLAEDAGTNHKATDVPAKMINLLKDAPDGRLVVFWDSDIDDDDRDEDEQRIIELADEEDVPAFDITKGMDPFTFEDPETAEPDAAADEVEAPRGRRRGNLRAVDEDDTGSSDDLPGEEELEAMGLVALKKLAAARLGLDEEDLKGKRKATVIRMLVEGSAEPARAGAEDDVEPSEATTEGDATQGSFFDEAQALAGVGSEILETVPEHVRLTPATREAIRTAAADFAEALLTAFVVEARKPKSAGRPRDDGTEAAPVPADVKNAPRRPRGRPRKQAEPEVEEDRPRRSRR